MSGVAKKLMSASGGVAGFTAIEDVFSCFLYTGNGSTQTITNGIDLAGEGGLVWQKSRVQADDHRLSDTERGVNKTIRTNQTGAEFNLVGSNSVSQFNSDGFVSGLSDPFFNGEPIASWTFRKAPRFFDVVTYTGNGVAYRTLPHNLGVRPGAIVIKRTDSTGDWFFMHRGNTTTSWFHTGSSGGNPDFGKLNTQDAFTYLGASTSACYAWIGTNDTSFEITGGDPLEFAANITGGTYVAYLFAHDPLGPSGDGSDGLIDCGSYTGNGLDDGPTISLGWEPQWLLVKRSTGGTGEWILVDTMRGMTADGNVAFLAPNFANAEVSNNYVRPTADGFKLTATGSVVNASGSTYIYIAIRRGPMRAPTSGTEVFDISNDIVDPNISSDILVDSQWLKAKTQNQGWFWHDRLRQGSGRLDSATTDSETTGDLPTYLNIKFDQQTGTKNTGGGFGSGYLAYHFRRAPEFFDVVAYTGNNTTQTVSHNLGVAPEMMIVKSRNNTGTWPVYHTALGNTQHINLNEISTPDGSSNWSNQTPTDTVFYVSASGFSADVNGSGKTFIAYLFSTLAGISKVGSYTGNGTSQTINCGFTSSARFLIIKRTDAVGDWYVWDTARGIIAGNDPFLELNSIAAEVTTDDSIDPASSGFIVNQTAVTDVNVNAASYIFYAVS